MEENIPESDNRMTKTVIAMGCTGSAYSGVASASSKVFRELLRTNFHLTHLRLPFCAEMDPEVDFLLKLNRTGLRQKLLKGNPTRGDSLEALVEMQQKSNNSVPESLNKTGFSVLFHMLREMPTLFALAIGCCSDVCTLLYQIVRNHVVAEFAYNLHTLVT